MTDLSTFSDEEAELIISLPYKVGVWVSYADDEEGETDDEKEARALESCIKAIAGLYDDKPFVKQVAAATLEKRSEWPRWSEGVFQVPSEAEAAMALLRSKATNNNVKNYRAALMEIATTVAKAYGEFGSFDEDEEEGGAFGALLGKITGGFSSLSHDDQDHPMNISPAEDSALSQLAAALQDKEE